MFFYVSFLFLCVSFLFLCVRVFLFLCASFCFCVCLFWGVGWVFLDFFVSFWGIGLCVILGMSFRECLFGSFVCLLGVVFLWFFVWLLGWCLSGGFVCLLGGLSCLFVYISLPADSLT